MQRLRAALDAERVIAEVTEVAVEEPALAQRLKFLGSPSVRINGVDVEPAARHAKHFGLMCRTYATPHGLEGAPSIETIRAALRAHSASQTGIVP